MVEQGQGGGAGPKGKAPGKAPRQSPVAKKPAGAKGPAAVGGKVARNSGDSGTLTVPAIFASLGSLAGLIFGPLLARWEVAIAATFWFAASFLFWRRLGASAGPSSIGAGFGELYGAMVRGFIARIDRWFGDTDPERLGIAPRAFGLAVPAPLWTKASFDRTLLVSSIYPIVVMMLVWAWTGESDYLARAVGLRPDAATTTRVFAAISLAALPVLAWKFYYSDDWMRSDLLWGGGMLAAIMGIIFFASVQMVIPEIAIVASIIIIKRQTNIPVGIMCCIFAFMILSSLGISNSVLPSHYNSLTTVLLYILTCTICGSLLWRLRSILDLKFYYLITVICLICLCGIVPLFATANSVVSYRVSTTALLLLIVMSNAPFDWLALGITRGLLRRGQEKGGLWPLWLGVIDLLASLIIALALAAAMIFVIQWFNAALASNGFNPIVPLSSDLKLMANPVTRGDPALWWIYATLLATQIPSLVNLAIGSFAFLRTLSFLNGPIDRLLQQQQASSGAMQIMVAAALGLQATIGTALAVLVTVAVIYALFFLAVPALGGNLLDLYIALADADYPRQLIGMFF